jgi:hypothetical protein
MCQALIANRPVIHLLVLGTCTYQFSGRGKELIIDIIGWNLPLLDFMNAMYIYSWTNQEYKYGRPSRFLSCAVC